MKTNLKTFAVLVLISALVFSACKDFFGETRSKGYTVSGRITLSGGSGVVTGVSVTLIQGINEISFTTPDLGGNYIFSGVAAGNGYQVAAYLAGYTTAYTDFFDVSGNVGRDIVLTAGETGPVAVTSVNLDKTNLDIYERTTAALTATVYPLNATNKAITWTINPPGIATLFETSVGTVTVSPITTGTATITAATVDGNCIAFCSITVLPPIQISSLVDLQTINDNPANMNKSYKLMADITGMDTPIGNIWGTTLMPFTGDFDGNGKKVTVNITSGLTVSSDGFTGTCAGLFAVLGGSVHDLTVDGTISINGSTPIAGGVTGIMLPDALINNVASSVNVNADGTGSANAGGVVGIAMGTVSKVSATGNVTATTTDAAHAGGIVGAARGTVSNVYTTGNVTATTSGVNSAYAGGIAGVVSSSGGTLSYAYATGNIEAKGTGTGTTDDTIGAGGIAGAATGALVRYTVALNSSVKASGNYYNRCSYRITSTRGGTVSTGGATNYGKGDLTPEASGSGGYSHLNHKGYDKGDGEDVTASDLNNETWWTGTGFSGSDWTTVWQWDTQRPALR
jgi:hypothetical protein